MPTPTNGEKSATVALVGICVAKGGETKFKEKVVIRLKRVPKCWFFKTQLLALIGIPDIIGCVNGRFFAWELKVGRNTATKKQKLVLAMIRKAGGIGSVVKPEDLEEALSELIKRCL